MHFTNHFESSISERKPTAVEWYEPEADGFGPSGASRSGARPENTQKRRRDKRALPLAAWEWDRRDATGGAEAPYLLPSIDRTPGSALRLSSLGRGPRRPARRRRSARTSPWLRVPLHQIDVLVVSGRVVVVRGARRRRGKTARCPNRHGRRV